MLRSTRVRASSTIGKSCGSIGMARSQAVPEPFGNRSDSSHTPHFSGERNLIRQPHQQGPMTKSVLCLVVACAVARGTSQPAQATVALSEVLTRYEHGEYPDAALQETLSIGLERLGREFEVTAPVWVHAAGPDVVERRRLVVSGLVLELAGAMIEDGRTKPIADRIQAWPALRNLIEWACSFLRSNSQSTAGERLWHLAALDLAADVPDHPFISGLPSGTSPDRALQMRREYGPALGHGRHALSRLPDDRLLELLVVESREAIHIVASLIQRRREVSQSELVKLEEEARNFSPSRRSISRRAGAMPDGRSMSSLSGPGSVRNSAVVETLRTVSRLQTATRELQELEPVEETRARILLDLGAIALCFADRAKALEHFAEVGKSPADPYVRYLGHFLTGRVHELQGHWSEAEAAYRRALEVIPRTHSGTTALAALLFVRGRGAEAAALIEDSLAGPADLSDPWIDFQQGGQVQWPNLIRQLRATF